MSGDENIAYGGATTPSKDGDGQPVDSTDLAPISTWTLRILNFLVTIIGGLLGGLALKAYMDQSLGDSLLSLMVIIAVVLIAVGIMGIICTLRCTCKIMLGIYFIGLFFMAVFALWCALYSWFNFSTIEDSIKKTMEKSWSTILPDFNDDMKALLPLECGGNLNATVISANATASAAFDSCYATIKDSVADNFQPLAIVATIAALLMIISVICAGNAFGVRRSVDWVKTVIDTGMAIVGIGVLAAGILLMVLTDPTETAKLAIPMLVIGSIMVTFGLVFGCLHTACADRCHAGGCSACCKAHTTVALICYALVLIGIAGLAIGCLVYQNDVQEIADQNRGLLDSICDPECSALLEQEFSEAHAVFMDYNMTDDAMQHLDSNCTDALTEEDCLALDEDCIYTPPVDPVDLGWCNNPVDARRRAYLIQQIVDNVVTIGWVCILADFYILTECLCLIYLKCHHEPSSTKDAEDKDAEDKDATTNP